MAVTYSGDAATTRTNLGLGSLATASSVNASTIDDNSVGAAELNVSGNGTSGQLLASDGDGTFSWATVSGGGDYIMRTYTAPATWTKPANLKAVKVTVIGGGGGGGGTRGPSTFGGIGGGGGSSVRYIPAPLIPGPVAVTRGAGGSGGPAPGSNGSSNASSGGTSSFGAYASATGGGGATIEYAGGTGRPGTGGSGSSGDINIPGGRAAYESLGNQADGSQGTLLSFPNQFSNYASIATPGQAGVGYGGGGTGGQALNSGSAYAGGAGAGGIIIVEEFY
jgi:hypothetical protein